MSRSRRHTPITGITLAESEKDDKRRANRKFRRVAGIDGAYTLRLVSNVWNWAKDGKSRFDPERYPELMRK